MFHGFILALILTALSLVLADVADRFPAFLGISSRFWSAFSIAQFVAGMIFAILGSRQYRCPACGKILRGRDKYYFGLDIDPSRCSNCGTRLK